MTLEDIEIVTDILREALKDFTNKSIIYGGSVNDTNIAPILRITDGVIIGTASQKAHLSRSLYHSMTRLKPSYLRTLYTLQNPDKQYEVVCIAKDKETLQDLVVYRALYPVLDLEMNSHKTLFLSVQ